MGQLNLSGALLAGPPSAGESFPASQFNVPIAFRETTKGFGVASGVLTRNLSSPAAYVALDGVGPTSTVTQGTFLYFKCDGVMDLRITQDDGSGGQQVAVVPVHGIVMIEFPSTNPLELLEAQGSGKLEYLVAGQS